MEQDILKIVKELLRVYVNNHNVLLIGNETVDKEIVSYIRKVQTFVLSEGYAKMYQFNFNEEGVRDLWSMLREDPDISRFVIQFTGLLKFKFEDCGISWEKVVRCVIEAMSLRIEFTDKEFDQEFTINLPTRKDVETWCNKHDWLVTVALINLMGPVRL